MFDDDGLTCLTLPYHPGQAPGVEPSSGPNAHPHINPIITWSYYWNLLQVFFANLRIVLHCSCLRSLGNALQRILIFSCQWQLAMACAPSRHKVRLVSAPGNVERVDRRSSLSVLMAISRWTWVNRCLLKQRMMEVVVMTTGLLELYVVQISSQIITTNKPTTSFFTGRMPFLSPNHVKALKGKYHIPWLPFFTVQKASMQRGLPCLSSALWCQYPSTEEVVQYLKISNRACRMTGQTSQCLV